MPHPRQFGQLCAASEHQVGQRASGKVGGGDTVSDISAGLADPRRRIEAHGGRPVSRHGEHTAPSVRDPDAAGLRQHRVQHAGQMLDGGVADRAVPVDPRAVAVRHSAAAQCDPAIRRALRVERIRVRGH